MLVIFDMDGVLVDSTDTSCTILTSYYNSIGIKAVKNDFLPYRGRGQEILLSGYARHLNIDFNLEEASLFYFNRYEEILNKTNAVLPGVKSFISMLKKANITIAIASSAPKWRVEANLKALGYTIEDFSLVLSAKDVEKNKPDPEIYNKAMSRLKASPVDTLIVEDSLSGLIAARESGANVLAVLTSEEEKEIKKLGINYIVPSLDKINKFSTLEEFNSALKDLAIV